MSFFSKFKSFFSQVQVVAQRVEAVLPQVQAAVAVSTVVNAQVKSEHQARIDAVLSGVQKDLIALQAGLAVITPK